MFLDITEKFSVFQSQNKYYRDSIMVSGNINLSGLPKPKISFSVVKNKLTREICYRNSFGTEHFQYFSPIDSVQWELLTDTVHIAGFNCHKAQTILGGRQYTAWYTTEIPISDGPYKFCNLPGLIIELSDTKNHYSFKLTGIYTDNISFSFADRLEYTTVTRKQYLQYADNIKKHPEVLFQLPPGTTITSANGDSINTAIQNRVEKLREQYKKNNNPLEFF